MKIQKPSIRELQTCLTGLKQDIQNEYINHEDDLPHMDITLACGPKGYALQTGDNSFSGPAYQFPFWGVDTLYRNSNCTDLAKDLIEQCLDLAAY